MATLNPRYTFASFVTGTSNEAAASSAAAVAESPGNVFNPLFVYGDTGLGKTHLMQAVAHDVHMKRALSRVVYETAEEFLTNCVRAVGDGTLEEFRSRYASATLLLIDDVHVLARRPEAQSEFALVFGRITMRGGQVMLTSDRAPGETGIESALVKRFALGKVAQIKNPEWDHRLAILQAKVAADLLEPLIPPEVLEFIATHVPSNVRAAEGAITRLLAYARLKSAPVTVEAARRVLRVDSPALLADASRESDPMGTAVQLIVRAVARDWGTSSDALHGSRRTRDVAEPRQVAMHLCRDLLEMPLAEIGRRFGGRDHTTVMYAIDRITTRLSENVALSRRHQALRASLRPLVSAALHSTGPSRREYRSRERVG